MMLKCIVCCCMLKDVHLTFPAVGTLCPFWPKAFRVTNYALTLSVICSAVRSSLLWRRAKFIFATMVSQYGGNVPDKKASILFLDRHSNVNVKQGDWKSHRQPTKCINNGLLIIPFSSTCFGRWFLPSLGALDCVYSLWYNKPTISKNIKKYK
jgi:hypothetical protein